MPAWSMIRGVDQFLCTCHKAVERAMYEVNLYHLRNNKLESLWCFNLTDGEPCFLQLRVRNNPSTSESKIEVLVGVNCENNFILQKLTAGQSGGTTSSEIMATYPHSLHHVYIADLCLVAYSHEEQSLIILNMGTSHCGSCPLSTELVPFSLHTCVVQDICLTVVALSDTLCMVAFSLRTMKPLFVASQMCNAYCRLQDLRILLAPSLKSLLAHVHEDNGRVFLAQHISRVTILAVNDVGGVLLTRGLRLVEVKFHEWNDLRLLSAHSTQCADNGSVLCFTDKYHQVLRVDVHSCQVIERVAYENTCLAVSASCTPNASLLDVDVKKRTFLHLNFKSPPVLNFTEADRSSAAYQSCVATIVAYHRTCLEMLKRSQSNTRAKSSLVQRICLTWNESGQTAPAALLANTTMSRMETSVELEDTLSVLPPADPLEICTRPLRTISTLESEPQYWWRLCSCGIYVLHTRVVHVQQLIVVVVRFECRGAVLVDQAALRVLPMGCASPTGTTWIGNIVTLNAEDQRVTSHILFAHCPVRSLFHGVSHARLAVYFHLRFLQSSSSVRNGPVVRPVRYIFLKEIYVHLCAVMSGSLDFKLEEAPAKAEIQRLLLSVAPELDVRLQWHCNEVPAVGTPLCRLRGLWPQLGITLLKEEKCEWFRPENSEWFGGLRMRWLEHATGLRLLLRTECFQQASLLLHALQSADKDLLIEPTESVASREAVLSLRNAAENILREILFLERELTDLVKQMLPRVTMDNLLDEENSAIPLTEISTTLQLRRTETSKLTGAKNLVQFLKEWDELALDTMKAMLALR